MLVLQLKWKSTKSGGKFFYLTDFIFIIMITRVKFSIALFAFRNFLFVVTFTTNAGKTHLWREKNTIQYFSHEHRTTRTLFQSDIVM